MPGHEDDRGRHQRAVRTGLLDSLAEVRTPLALQEHHEQVIALPPDRSDLLAALVDGFEHAIVASPARFFFEQIHGVLVGVRHQIHECRIVTSPVLHRLAPHAGSLRRVQDDAALRELTQERDLGEHRARRPRLGWQLQDVVPPEL